MPTTRINRCRSHYTLQPFLPPAMNTRLTNEISSLLLSVTNTMPLDMTGPSDSAPLMELHDDPSAAADSASGLLGGGASGGVGATVRGGRGRRPRHRLNNFHLHEFENIVQDFLVNVTGRAGGAVSGGVALPSSMYFMGNPEDYVYGRDGLDTIVTQLLNQMDGTGPPPLAKDKIDEIPKVAVTKEQVDEKLQCSICWEDFQMAETVRKLPCVVSLAKMDIFWSVLY